MAAALTTVSAAASVAAVLALTACRSEPDARPMPPPDPAAARTSTSPNLARIELAIHRYADDRAGRLPVALDDLRREGPPEGGHYLRDVPLDPWGRPYSYAVTDPRSGSFDLRSYGPDTLPGTEDDVVGRNAPVPLGRPVGTSETR